MPKLEIKDIFTVIEDYDVFLFDLWGVIIEKEAIYPGVVDTINKIIKTKKTLFVSNIPRTRYIAYEKIREWGIDVTPEMIFTSGEVARNLINNSKVRFNINSPVIYHLGAELNDNIISDMNYQNTNDIREANILLITVYRDENENLHEFDDLLKASIDAGTINICANPDIVAPGDGILRYCAGYFAAKVEKFGGEVLYTGKPNLEIYQQVMNSLPPISKKRILMIGDTFETDIKGANDFGIDSALVLTGNASRFYATHLTMEEKLLHLQNAAVKAKAAPNFVINLSASSYY